MCVEPTTLALIAAVASTAVSAGAAYQQSRTAKAVAENNADAANVAAADALRRGEQDSQKSMREARLMMGSQRAAYSARGLDISSGTPADVIEQTDFFGRQDAAQARTNARKEAWSIQNRGAAYSAEARAQNPFLSTTSTLLGGAGSVADRWYQYKQPKAG